MTEQTISLLRVSAGWVSGSARNASAMSRCGAPAVEKPGDAGKNNRQPNSSRRELGPSREEAVKAHQCPYAEQEELEPRVPDADNWEESEQRHREKQDGDTDQGRNHAARPDRKST